MGGQGKNGPLTASKRRRCSNRPATSYYGGVFLQGDCSRSPNGSSETPVTDVASVIIAERAAEIGETVARKQWLQPCSPTLLRLHAKMHLGMIRTLLQLFLRGFTPWDAKIDNLGSRLSEAMGIAAQARGRRSFPKLPCSDRQARMRLGPSWTSTLCRRIAPEPGSNLCKIVAKYDSYLESLLSPASQWQVFVHDSWKTPMKQIRDVLKTVFSQKSFAKDVWRRLSCSWFLQVCRV